MVFKEIGFFIFCCWLLKYATAQQDPRFMGHIPTQCGEDTSFCNSYCLSIDPGTVHASCGRDRVSCICTNANEQSVGVRFVMERNPVPFTTTTTTTTTPAPPPVFDYTPNEPVPQLLECDGSQGSTTLCNDFCIFNVQAISGQCDVDRTCRCEGVASSVLQQNPISAIYVPPLPPQTPPPTHAPEIAMQQSFWTPITQGHPNYNYNNPNPINVNSLQHQQTPEQFQYTYQQPYGLGFYTNQPSYMYPPPPPPVNYQYAYWNPIGDTSHQQPKDLLPTPVEEFPPEEGITTLIPEVTSENTDLVEEPVVEDETMAQPELENHKVEEVRRKKRSPITSYPNIFNFGNSRESCSLSSCLKSCISSNFGSDCSPLCMENTCKCLCNPKEQSSSFSSVVNSQVDQIVNKVLGTVSVSPPFDITPSSSSLEDNNGEVKVQTSSMSSSTNSDGSQSFAQEDKTSFADAGSNPADFFGFNHGGAMSQEDFLNLFKAPPTLYH